jgi:hypothetical protein
VGLGLGVFGIGDIPGVGDIDGMDGICSFGIFMSFIMEAQQSSFGACMEPECAKKRRYMPATMMKIPTAMPVMARAGYNESKSRWWESVVG